MRPCQCLFKLFHQASEYLLGNLNNSVVLYYYSDHCFIGASLSEPHTHRTAVQNPPDIYIIYRNEKHLKK